MSQPKKRNWYNLRHELKNKKLKQECASKSQIIQDLQTEIEQKNLKIQALEDSGTKAQKIKDFLTTKIFLNDSANESLQSLLNLEICELFTKYEKITTVNNSKLQETIETLADVKTKLNLQIVKREAYEKQHTEIMALLNLPKENWCFANILQAIKSLKESNSEMRDEIEADHYENAGIAIASSSSSGEKINEF